MDTNQRILDIVLQLKDDATQKMTGFKGALQSVGEVAAGIGLERVAEEITHLGEEAAKFALDTAASFEQTATSFETILGSAQTSGKLLTNLSNWEIHTPWTFEQITSAAKQMLAFGANANDVLPRLKEMSDLAMGDPSRLSELVSIWGEVNSQQEVTGRTVLRLSSIGIPIYGALTKAIGEMGGKADLTAKQIKDMMGKGEITPEDFNKAMDIMTQKGGMFFQETQRQSHTFEGVVSSIHSQFQRLALSVMGVDISGNIEKDGLFAKIKDLAQSLLDYLSGHKDQIASSIKGMIDGIIKFGEWIVAHKDIIVGFIGALSGLAVIATLIPIISGIATAFSILGAVFAAGAAGGGLAAIGTIIAALGGPVTLLAIVIGAAAMLIITHWKQVSTFFNTAKTVIEQAIKATATVFANIGKAISTFFSDMGKDAQKGWNALKGVFSAIVSYIASVLTPPFTIIKFVLEFLWDYFLLTWTQIKALLDAFGRWFQATFGKQISDTFNAVHNGLTSVWNWFVSIWKQIENFLTSTWHTISSTVSGAVNAIVSFISTQFTAISDWINKNFLTPISSAWSTFWGGLKSTVSTIAGEIKTLAKDLINSIIGWIDGLIHGFNSLGKHVPGFIALPEIPKLATGTNFFQGGLAVVGEEGPELVNLPRGSQVIPNSQISNFNNNASVQIGPVYVSNQSDVNMLAQRLAFLMKTSGRY